MESFTSTRETCTQHLQLFESLCDLLQVMVLYSFDLNRIFCFLGLTSSIFLTLSLALSYQNNKVSTDKKVLSSYKAPANREPFTVVQESYTPYNTFA